jgi:VIT1/CCC1 family predicted Fe2+/Mn2+ transporter
LSITKRIDQARAAYAKKDLSAAAEAHDPNFIAESMTKPPEEHGGASSQYVGDFIYGGLDGVVTTFAVVSGVAGAALGTDVILILGLANLFADGFSMATGAYLSAKSENEYYDRERQRELWEVENFPEGEQAELREIYRNKGYTGEEAHDLVEIFSRVDERIVDAMMIDELGLMKSDKKPFYSAVATLASFIVIGAVPLLIYFLGLIADLGSANAFPISIALSALALFGLGAGKVLVTHQNPIKNGLEMLFVGGSAAVVAYFVGALLKGLGV